MRSRNGLGRMKRFKRLSRGQPWHNGFVESFHNRMRDELLEDNSIENLEHARMLVAQWSRRYNDFHPHSSLSYLSPRKYAEQ
ncbi:transposase [Arcanobacterium haemolyticum]|nr:transposase [Arcanobacterium haemolyticum]